MMDPDLPSSPVVNAVESNKCLSGTQGSYFEHPLLLITMVDEVTQRQTIMNVGILLPTKISSEFINKTFIRLLTILIGK